MFPLSVAGELVALVVGASALATAIFHTGMYIGRLRLDVERTHHAVMRAHDRLDGHDKILRKVQAGA